MNDYFCFLDSTKETESNIVVYTKCMQECILSLDHIKSFKAFKGLNY